jgi:cytochrome c
LKKYLLAIGLVVLIGACSSNNSNEKKEAASVSPAPAPVADLSANPDYQKGLALIAKSDCLTCHKTDAKLIGPAYKDVSAKYEHTEANIEMLAGKVLKGGGGVWSPVPMTPHPQLSLEDAKQMVKYIFLLNK